MTTKDDVVNYLMAYLKAQNLSAEAVERIVGEDLEYLLNWELEPDSKEQLEKAQGIIAFSFGYGPTKPECAVSERSSYDPMAHCAGASNEAMAELIVRLKKDDEDIFAQWEIAESLRQKHGINIKGDHIARPDKAYLGTSGVVRQFLDRGLRSDSYERIIVVAHRHHTYRCLKVAEKVFLDEGLSKKLLVPDNPSVYDPMSLQDWTTNLENWVAYEVGNRFSNRFQKNMLDLRRDRI